MMVDNRSKGHVLRGGLATVVLCAVAFFGGSLWEKSTSRGGALREDQLRQLQQVLDGLQTQAQTISNRQVVPPPPIQNIQQPKPKLPKPVVAPVAAPRSMIDVCDFPRPTSAVEHYDETYFGWQVKENRNNVGWQLTRLKPSLEASPRAAVLEVGCSGGYTLARVSAGSKHCFEINDAAIRHARATFPDIHIYSKWADVPDDTIDYAYSFDSFEHHASPLDNLMCLFQKMRRGGEVHIEVPFEHAGMGGTALDVYGRRYKPGNVNNHLFTWSPMLLGNMVHASGFRVKACRDGEEIFRMWKAQGRQNVHGPREVLAIWCIGVKD
uniref:Methyltransferase type 11 domain-containing protein n=1 Tax=Tetraselmis chuii TaxID=63592 RepID=A0A7S1X780_9CHLO|mmetsp:Transcript_35722/g.63701  ORF Transcript_35722/g.63701 Transcript_35722/m.63701 type:complete len:324 (+) Transcript_35722:67-1038(+)